MEKGRMLEPEEYRNKAMALFREGYNCSQAVLLAFEELVGVDRRTLAMMASSFGGGMGRLREVCGTVSGACMVLGVLYGFEKPEKAGDKAEHYGRIQEFAGEFQKKYGTIICRNLLKKPEGAEKPQPEERTEQYYKVRPCERIVGDSAYLVATFINRENGFDV